MRTIVVASHDHDLVSEFASRQFVLDNGKLTEATAAAALTRWRTSTINNVRQRLATISSSPPPPIQLRAQMRQPRSHNMRQARRSAAAPAACRSLGVITTGGGVDTSGSRWSCDSDATQKRVPAARMALMPLPSVPEPGSR